LSDRRRKVDKKVDNARRFTKRKTPKWTTGAYWQVFDISRTTDYKYKALLEA